VVEANVRAATLDVAPGTVMNIAGGTNVSVNEVLEIMGRTTRRTIAVDRRPRFEGDVQRTGGDASLAGEILGWKPQVGIEEGIARQWEWVRGRRHE
jgi:nucleoside-diphosphate-sugar epimerase